jgi:hypothetical protein
VPNRIALPSLVAVVVALTGCSASQKSFYASPAKIKDTQLCRTYLEAAEKGDMTFAGDVAKEAIARELTLEQCQRKVATENGVLVATALIATAVGVGVACRDGCSGGGYYAPTRAAYATDYDCLGGGGDGPYYVQGPFRLTGPDVYGLDADHDGIACELGEGGFGT